MRKKKSKLSRTLDVLNKNGNRYFKQSESIGEAVSKSTFVTKIYFKDPIDGSPANHTLTSIGKG